MRVRKTALCRGMFTFDRTPGANVSSLRGCRNHIVCRKLKNKPFCYAVSRAGRRVALNGYNYFMRVNAARAQLGLSRFDLPPTAGRICRKSPAPSCPRADPPRPPSPRLKRRRSPSRFPP